MVFDPLTVACPKCGAPPGRRCSKIVSTKAGRRVVVMTKGFHKERVAVEPGKRRRKRPDLKQGILPF